MCSVATEGKYYNDDKIAVSCGAAEEFPELVHLPAIGNEQLEQYVCLFAVDDLSRGMAGLVAEGSDDGEDSGEVCVEVFLDLGRKGRELLVELALELVHLLKDGPLLSDSRIGAGVGWAVLDGLHQQ